MPIRFPRLFPIVLVAGFTVSAAAHAQKVPNPPTIPNSSADTAAPSTDSPFANTNPPDPERAHMLRNMIQERNKIRQKQIIDDTQQLLDLAKELQEAVAKSNKNELSLNVVNTAAEIEKLAKTVKEKMRDGQ